MHHMYAVKSSSTYLSPLPSLCLSVVSNSAASSLPYNQYHLLFKHYRPIVIGDRRCVPKIICLGVHGGLAVSYGTAKLMVRSSNSGQGRNLDFCFMRTLGGGRVVDNTWCVRPYPL